MTDAEIIREFMTAFPATKRRPKADGGRIVVHPGLAKRFNRWCKQHGHRPKVVLLGKTTPTPTITDDEFDHLRAEFVAERPDLAGAFVTLEDGQKVIDVKAVPQFALWAVGKGYADPSAFGLSIEMQNAVNDHFDKLGL